MKKFSVLIAGRHATSVSLEEEFYDDLLKIAAAQNVSCNKLITQIDSERTTDNLSSAVRRYVLQYYKNLATPKWGGEQYQNRDNFQTAQKHGKGQKTFYRWREKGIISVRTDDVNCTGTDISNAGQNRR